MRWSEEYSGTHSADGVSKGMRRHIDSLEQRKQMGGRRREGEGRRKTVEEKACGRDGWLGEAERPGGRRRKNPRRGATSRNATRHPEP